MSHSIVTGRRIAFYAAWYAAVMFTSVTMLRAQDLREEFHQSYPLAAAGRVSLHNVNGNVEVIGWDRNEVRVDAVKHARTQEALREAEIVVDSRPDAIDIRTRYPERSGGNRDGAGVNYTISVPRLALLDQIRTVNGNVDISGIGGQVKAGSVNGNVRAHQPAGEVSLSTTNGNVEADIDGMEAKPVSLKSVNGTVTLGLPQNAGARLSAKTTHGRISSDFGLPAQHVDFGPGRDVETTIGAGGPDVQVRTTNGNIRIRRR